MPRPRKWFDLANARRRAPIIGEPELNFTDSRLMLIYLDQVLNSDGSGITIGSGKTLDVSGGTLTLADGQIPAAKVDGAISTDWTVDQVTVDIHANNIPDLSSVYATSSLGVTNGNSHDHSGGDGAQIAYSSLSGTPSLGTISSQASNNVSITGGSITGITDLAVADGGTGASTAADARTNLGLGSISTQASSSVSITGGTISGCDITVGAGKTLNVSAGTLTLADNQISGDKIEGGTIAAITITTLTTGAGSEGSPAVIPTGDTNTGIWYPAVDTWAVSTGGTERIRITSAGNVGIGTTSPSEKLEVVGTVRIHGGSSTATIELKRASDGWNPATIHQSYPGYYGGDLEFKLHPYDDTLSTAPATTVIFKGNGNVGIGTTSPGALLDVNSDIIRLRTAKTPATAGATGNAGDICWDSGAIYVCVASNTWKKVAIATW